MGYKRQWPTERTSMAVYSYRPPWEYSVILHACSGAPVPREQLRRSTWSRKSGDALFDLPPSPSGTFIGRLHTKSTCSGSRLDVAYFAEGCTWDDVVSPPGRRGLSLVVHVASQVI